MAITLAGVIFLICLCNDGHDEEGSLDTNAFINIVEDGKSVTLG